ncbi:MAG: GNAT family N-acetyltransferase [Oscillospiraceae bacterium]
MDKLTDYEIFRACFPGLSLSEGEFQSLTRHDSRFAAEGGFALTSGGRLALLCVHPEYSGRGTGSALLSQCEEHIAANGYDRVVLGGELFGGAVGGGYDFFRRRGYSLGSEFCEMRVDIRGYSDTLPDVDAEFRLVHETTAALINAVNAVDPEWAQYFSGEFLCGFTRDGGLVSFCIVEDNVVCSLSDGLGSMGSVGCVGTVPAARGRGIGLKMVSLALEELSRRGCKSCLIHQTHLCDWYAKLGAGTVYRFREGEKIIE